MSIQIIKVEYQKGLFVLTNILKPAYGCSMLRCCHPLFNILDVVAGHNYGLTGNVLIADINLVQRHRPHVLRPLFIRQTALTCGWLVERCPKSNRQLKVSCEMNTAVIRISSSLLQHIFLLCSFQNAKETESASTCTDLDHISLLP